jgi:FkbM family methyltransferase
MNAPASQPTTPEETLQALLRPQRLTAVVDVGANPIDGDTPYKSLLERRLCTVVGFEPQPDGLAVLNARKSDLESYLPHVVGDGGPATLHITALPGMTSLLEPNQTVLRLFHDFEKWATVLQNVPVQTRRLDDVPQVAALDMLKIDVQGSELAVFKGARGRLGRAVTVHTEVCFLQLYKNQPLFGEIDIELRSLGFVPHHMVHVNTRTILPTYHESMPQSGVNQAIFADIVYVRDFSKGELMDDEQLKHLAIIAYQCYGSFDLTIHCLYRLAERKAVVPNAVDLFIDSMKAAAPA